MALHVYITEKCRKDCRSQNYDRPLQALAERIETSQSAEILDRFPRPFLKKRFERQIRLVAKEVEVGEHTVVAFLRLLVRGGNEYQAFIDSHYSSLPGEDAMEGEISEVSLARIIEERKEPPPPPPPPPSPTESEYLHAALTSTKDIYSDYHCCETALWVKRISQEEFTTRLSLFHLPVLNTIDSGGSGLEVIRCERDSEFGLLYRRIPENKTVILFTPFRGEEPKAEVENAFTELLADGELEKEVVLRRAKRAYPHDLLLSEDAWMSVQRNREGNMALSEEEIDVLESARLDEGRFPLFINGRAGSGKSTILQYLFSEYVYHYLRHPNDLAPPLFFACNDDLLAQCRTSVESLVRGLHRESESFATDRQWEDRLSDALRRGFLNFHHWLRHLAGPERFPVDRLVDYGRFKHWWEDSFGRNLSMRRLFDADLSWHVIRTYIKGISAEGHLDPDDYLEIPSKQKSVAPETYRVVFEKVWESYRQFQHEQKLWDHQDLARFVIEEGKIRPDYPVIFCDEAQDFTRIELEVLNRHCLFNTRSLNAYEHARIPIAFAGDPFQTLNPTGFRWEATAAFFAEKFIRTFPGEKRRDINYRELSYNYRSSRNIVRFCNSLQLVRSVVFGFTDIRPQHPWEDEDDSPNVSYYEKGDVTVLNALKTQSEIRIIVPCEEGDEAEWVRRNGLGDYVEFDDADVPKNVASATRVKGLEFTRVVLFGFGGACPEPLRNAIGDPESTLTGDRAIEPQYFLNRLYVAASRPRRRLFVIDERRDIEQFWNRIYTDSEQETQLLRTEDPGIWENACGHIIKGALNTWQEDREDPTETAEKLASEGRLRKDRVLLRQAAQSYRSAGRQQQERECKAEALELERSFLEAAILWKAVGDINRSVRTAWRARGDGYQFILEVADSEPHLKNSIHWKFASFLNTKANLEEGVTLLRDLESASADDGLKEDILTMGAWRSAIEVSMERMLSVEESGKGLWDICYGILTDFRNAGVRITDRTIGSFAYRAGRLQDAHGHWAKLPTREISDFERDFLRARAATEEFPKTLETYGEILDKFGTTEDAEAILASVRTGDATKLRADHRELIVRARIDLKQLEDCLQDLEFLENLDLLISLLYRFAGRSNADAVQAIISRVAAVLAARGDWPGLVDFLRNRKIQSGESKHRTSVDLSSARKIGQDNPLLVDVPIIRYIARDIGFERDATNDLKSALSRILRDRFAKDFDWVPDLHPIEVGAAFERAGLFRDTLPFLESIRSHASFHYETQDLARIRWARMKGLQAQHEKDRVRKDRGSADSSVGANHLRDANDAARELGLKSWEEIPQTIPNVLPEIFSAVRTDPEPKTVTPEENRLDDGETTTQTETTDARSTDRVAETDFSRADVFAGCGIRVSRNGLRVNLEHQDSFEQASVDVNSRTVTVEGNQLPRSKTSESTPIGTWGLSVSFARLTKGKLEFEADDGSALIIPVETPPARKRTKRK